MKDETVALAPLVPLFKYLSLAPGMDPSWQQRLTQLLNGKAYFPSPQDFNDPFDCLPVTLVPETQEELDGVIDTLIARLTTATAHLPAADLDRMLRAGIAGKTPADIFEMARAGTALTASGLGVFCLAENINSVLMWSHYANNHRGIAVVFETYAEPAKQGLPPFFKVRYQEARATLGGLFTPEGIADDVVDALLVKADFWKYEQEWRAFAPQGAHKTIEFDHRIVTGIVFGANCKPEDEAWIREAIGARPMHYYRVTPDHRTFDLSLTAI